LDTFDRLFELAQNDWAFFINEARRLGMHAPTYPPKEAA
jgi:phenylalanine-4-hydroxylase